MRKRWRAQIPRNGLRPWNLRWDPCMRTKCGLWLTCPMIGKPLRINGSSRGRRTLIVVLLSTKLDLSQKGFRQVQGVDYNEIFSTVAMLKSVRIMLAIATFYEIWQMNVKTAFLMVFLKKSCIWCNQKVLSILKVLTKCASSIKPSMDWCKHLGVGIYALMSWSKHIVLYRLAVKPVFTRKWVGALQHFW